MFFIPETKWTSGEIDVATDFTYRDNVSLGSICNMTITQKSKMPRQVSDIVFQSNTEKYSTENVKGIRAETQNNKLRITATMNNTDFIDTMKSDVLELHITVDGIPYICKPSNEFISLKQEFLTLCFINGY
jgi:hypothetical protein